MSARPARRRRRPRRPARRARPRLRGRAAAVGGRPRVRSSCWAPRRIAAPGGPGSGRGGRPTWSRSSGPRWRAASPRWSRSRSSASRPWRRWSSLAVVALALDAVDGRVARRTGTVSPFGARLDGEADAFLMLVLSVHVARGGRCLGAGDRGGALRVRGGRVGAALDARRAAAAPLAQGRHRRRGDRAGRARRPTRARRRRTPPSASPPSCWPSPSAGTSGGCGDAGAGSPPPSVRPVRRRLASP